VLTDRKEDTMILKIIEDRNELLLEGDVFAIQSFPMDDEPPHRDLTQKKSGQCPVPQPWFIEHDNHWLKFDKAFLMNNDGGNIGRYG